MIKKKKTSQRTTKCHVMKKYYHLLEVNKTTMKKYLLQKDIKKIDYIKIFI